MDILNAEYPDCLLGATGGSARPLIVYFGSWYAVVFALLRRIQFHRRRRVLEPRGGVSVVLEIMISCEPVNSPENSPMLAFLM